MTITEQKAFLQTYTGKAQAPAVGRRREGTAF